MLPYFWFIVAGFFGLLVIVWDRQLKDLAKRGFLTPEEARRFRRGIVFWVIVPCLVLGGIALGAGWPDPSCVDVLSFSDIPTAATSSIMILMWAISLAWVWFGNGANFLGRVGAAFAERTEGKPISPKLIKFIATVIVLASAASTALPRQHPPVTRLPIQPSDSANGTFVIAWVFATFAMATWLIGINLLWARHCRRLGKSWWSIFRPFAFPFSDFNALEWLMLLCILAAAFCFAGIAVSLGPQ
jgi:hypothetical protein